MTGYLRQGESMRSRIDELLTEARGARNPAERSALLAEANALILLVTADAHEALVSATLAGNLEPLPRYAEAELGEVELIIDDARIEELCETFAGSYGNYALDQEGTLDGLRAVFTELGLLPLPEAGHVSADPDEREEESLVDPAEPDEVHVATMEFRMSEEADEDMKETDGIMRDPIAAALAASAEEPAEETPLERLRRQTKGGGK